MNPEQLLQLVKRTMMGLLVAQATWLGAAPVAPASLPASISATVVGERWGKRQGSLYKVTIASGVSDTAVGLSYELPPWPTPQLVFGTPLAVESIQLVGAGVLRPAFTLIPRLGSNPKYGCNREKPGKYGWRFWAEIPAGVTSVVEVRVGSTYPRWPGTARSLALFTFNSEEPGAEESVLPVDGTAPAGEPGTHIQLRSTGKRPGARWSPEVLGKTSPPLRNAPIFVRAARLIRPGGIGLDRWDAARHNLSIKVETDRRGRFVVPASRIPGRGLFGFLVRSKGNAAVAPDWNCGPTFSTE